MFELAAPWVLLALVLPMVCWFMLPTVGMSLPAALRVPFYQTLLTRMDDEGDRSSNSVSGGLFFIIWALIVLAAAGPRWVGEPIPLAREGRNIMLVLDLSGSMAFDDMFVNGQPTTRLAVVKEAAKKFVEARTGDKIGLIVFGTQAYLQTPLTFDRHSILLRIDDASVGLAGKTTSIGDALGLAVKRLQDASTSSRIVIFLTDGVNNSGVLAPLKAAELAHDDHIKVYTIGLGSDANNDPFSSGNLPADLDEKTLKTMAKITGGRYFRATDPETLQAIYNTINTLETVVQEKASIRPQKEYYPWPLAIALLLMLYWWLKKTMILTDLRAKLMANRSENHAQ